MITLKINLLNLKGAMKNMKTKSGKEVLTYCIPVEMNNLYQGEKGLYLDMVAFEVKEKKNDSKDTHLIKQSLSKDVRKAMTEEEKRAMPILGNLRVMDEFEEKEPVSSPEPDQGEDDSLPF